MHFSYNKLWKVLIDQIWKNEKLGDNYVIGSVSVANLEKYVNLTTEVLPKTFKPLPFDIVTFWKLCEINTLQNKRIEVTFTQNE